MFEIASKIDDMKKDRRMQSEEEKKRMEEELKYVAKEILC